jgi:hypothetical protein
MKKLIALIAVVVLCGTTLFAGVYTPGTTGHRTATGSFGCRVINPLVITPTNPGGSMGDFVKSTTPYTLGTGAVNNVIRWDIKGEPNYPFYFVVTSNTSNPSADIIINWTYTDSPAGGNINGFLDWYKTTSDNLSNNGTYFIQGIVTSVTAKASSNGSGVTFDQTLTCSYNTL